MNALQRFALSMAWVAIAVFQSPSADARQSPCEGMNIIPGFEQRVHEAQLSSSSSVPEDELASQHQVIEQMIDWLNCFTPYQLSEGLTVTSIDIDERIINFNASCNSFIAKAIINSPHQSLKENKLTVAQYLYDILSSAVIDDRGTSILDIMVKLNMEIHYNYYLEGSTTTARTIRFSARYIESAGQVNNNIFSI